MSVERKTRKRAADFTDLDCGIHGEEPSIVSTFVCQQAHRGAWKLEHGPT